jgi:hypothetical protein
VPNDRDHDRREGRRLVEAAGQPMREDGAFADVDFAMI